MYQNLNDGGYVAVINLARRVRINQWFMEGCDGPSGMALDATGRRLFIACNRNSRLAIFDLDRHAVIAAVPVGGHPDVVGYDPALNRIYTTGRSGVLSAIHQDSADSYHLIASTDLAFGAHTLAVDPISHRVYMDYVSLLTGPKLAVFDASR